MNLAAPSGPPAFICPRACHHAAQASTPGPPGPSPGANTRSHVASHVGPLPKSPGLPSLGSTLAGPRLACSMSLGPGRVVGTWQVLEKSRSGWGAGGQGGSGQSSPRLPLRVRLSVLSRDHGGSGQGHGCFLAPVRSGRPRIPWLMGSPRTRVPRSVTERPGQSPPTPMPLSEQKLESCQVSTTHTSRRLQMSTAGQRARRGQGREVSEEMGHLPRPAFLPRSPPPGRNTP